MELPALPHFVQTHGRSNPPAPARSLATVAGQGLGTEESQAMEAVRELLFGKRVAEFQSKLESLNDKFGDALQRFESLLQNRFGELERMLRETEGRLSQALVHEQLSRQNELATVQKSLDQRLSETEKYRETLALETARQLDMQRQEIAQARRELAAETLQLRQTTPTLHGLADLFMATSERLKGNVASTVDEGLAN